MERINLQLLKAAVEFAKADQEYLNAIHKILHKPGSETSVAPSPEELEYLFALQSNRNELEDRFWSQWVGDDWQLRVPPTVE